MKSRYWKTSHKYGVRLPHSVQEALQIDKETGTDFWWKAIQKEMKKVMIALDYDESVTPQQIRDGLAKGNLFMSRRHSQKDYLPEERKKKNDKQQRI